MKGNLFMLACAVSLVAVARENPVAIVVSGGRSQSRARQSAVSVHGLCVILTGIMRATHVGSPAYTALGWAYE